MRPGRRRLKAKGEIVRRAAMRAAGQPGQGPAEPPAQERWNLAARAGRWSSEHRRAAVIGWLVFAVTAAVIGFVMGTRSMSNSDYATGESAVAERILAQDFPQPAGESVFVHHPAATVRNPDFRAAIAAVVARL